MLRILVTGATGFIGRHVIECLLQNDVTVVSAGRKDSALYASPNYSHFRIDDIGLTANWSEILGGVSAIIHCAGLSGLPGRNIPNSVNELQKVNVDAARHLAQQAVSAGVKRFVFLSSIKVHGECTWPGNALSFETATTPASLYANSKLQAELNLREVLKDSGTELVIVRAPLVYGYGVKNNVNAIVKSLRFGIPLPLANIDNRRSFIYVRNLADFLFQSAIHPSAAGQIFLVADDKVFSTTNFVRAIADRMQVSPKLFYVPPPIFKLFGQVLFKEQEVLSLLSNLEVNCTHAQRLLGWSPPFSSETGLTSLVGN